MRLTGVQFWWWLWWWWLAVLGTLWMAIADDSSLFRSRDFKQLTRQLRNAEEATPSTEDYTAMGGDYKYFQDSEVDSKYDYFRPNFHSDGERGGDHGKHITWNNIKEDHLDTLKGGKGRLLDLLWKSKLEASLSPSLPPLLPQGVGHTLAHFSRARRQVPAPGRGIRLTPPLSFLVPPTSTFVPSKVSMPLVSTSPSKPLSPSSFSPLGTSVTRDNIPGDEEIINRPTDSAANNGGEKKSNVYIDGPPQDPTRLLHTHRDETLASTPTEPQMTDPPNIPVTTMDRAPVLQEDKDSTQSLHEDEDRRHNNSLQVLNKVATQNHTNGTQVAEHMNVMPVTVEQRHTKQDIHQSTEAIHKYSQTTLKHHDSNEAIINHHGSNASGIDKTNTNESTTPTETTTNEQERDDETVRREEICRQANELFRSLVLTSNLLKPPSSTPERNWLPVLTNADNSKSGTEFVGGHSERVGTEKGHGQNDVVDEVVVVVGGTSVNPMYSEQQQEVKEEAPPRVQLLGPDGRETTTDIHPALPYT
ncbi:hypothetical protein Pcinc_034999, partial [Petrolisthes cinctipes]